jgi:hypothetical protein
MGIPSVNRVMIVGILALCLSACRNDSPPKPNIAAPNPISVPGNYGFADSEWLDAVMIESERDDLIVTVGLKPRTTERGTSRKSLSHTFRRQEGWTVSVDGKERLVQYRVGDYQYVFDFSDPKNSKSFERP